MSRVPITVRIDSELNDWIKSEFPRGFKQLFLERSLKGLKTLVMLGLTDTTETQALKTTIHTIQESMKEED